MSNTDRRTFLQSAGLAASHPSLSSAALRNGTPAAREGKDRGTREQTFDSFRRDRAGVRAHLQHDRGDTTRWRPARGCLRPDAKQMADFRAKFGDVKVARSEDEILQDKSIQLVASAGIPDQRAPLGVRVMQAGKTISQTSPAPPRWISWPKYARRWRPPAANYAVMYSERLEVRSGRLCR